MGESKFDRALAAIDAAHADDPTKVDFQGSQQPYELVYAQKMTFYLSQRSPEASDLLKLAIRAQHLRRWEVPRDSYPEGLSGYYAWRTFLKHRQADLVIELCVGAGYSRMDAGKVGAMVRKEDLKIGGDSQVLEDVACLVFLDDQFEVFAKNRDETQILGILRKTWGKMSSHGQQLATALELDGRPGELLERALAV